MAIFKGHGLVWDGKQVIAKFENGGFQTEDAETIAILKKMGYVCTEEKKKAPRKGDTDGHTVNSAQ